MAGPDGEGADEAEAEDDPFSRLVLDDDFVRSAAVREPSARLRERQAQEALQAQQAELERDRFRQRRRERRLTHRAKALLDRHRPRLPMLAFLLLIVAALVGHQLAGGTGPDVTSTAFDAGSKDAPKGIAVPGGHYAFEATQPGTDQPVTYSSCAPIAVVVNEDQMPDGMDGLAQEAVAEIADLTGLDLRVTGSSSERPAPDRDTIQPGGLGRRWAPVLIVWSSPDEVTELEGDVAGVGGSASIVRGNVRTYVTGRVVLDGPDLAKLRTRDDGRARVKSVVLHELAHVVGLGHVSDATQLMAPVASQAVTEPQEGDRAGLGLLGKGACVPGL